ncbi:hypothetical protein LCGC14_1619670 [marine sediment metagenome]|uniref:Uncharacterized protein n=1 Tax=marine sediment metagenome TaxID=412755 RepID=A0A0F9ISU6_9ZZZZ
MLDWTWLILGLGIGFCMGWKIGRATAFGWAIREQKRISKMSREELREEREKLR